LGNSTLLKIYQNVSKCGRKSKPQYFSCGNAAVAYTVHKLLINQGFMHHHQFTYLLKLALSPLELRQPKAVLARQNESPQLVDQQFLHFFRSQLSFFCKFTSRFRA